VDLERGLLRFRDTKNKESRSVPISERALEVLRGLARIHRIDGRVLEEFPRVEWEKARAAAGLEGFRFHDLRHTAASWLAMEGATVAELAAILGHRTLLMVKRYAHFSQDHARPLIERMAGRLPVKSAGG
jgi:integrase